MARQSAIYQGLYDVLTQYISRLMARSVIDRALAQCKVRPEHLSAQNVADVVDQARIGIGMFCDPHRLPSLMVDLATFCEMSAPARPIAPRSAEPSELNKAAQDIVSSGAAGGAMREVRSAGLTPRCLAEPSSNRPFAGINATPHAPIAKVATRLPAAPRSVTPSAPVFAVKPPSSAFSMPRPSAHGRS